MTASRGRREGWPGEPEWAAGGGAVAAFAAAALLVAGSTAARGQEPLSAHAAAGTGAVVLEGEFGFEARAGAELRSGRIRVIARPVELAVLPGDSDPGYRWVTLSGGQRRCRDVATGRFARDTRCIELETKFGASGELAWRVLGDARPLLVGAGFRAGPGAGPYGAVRWRPVVASDGLSWHLQAAAGPELVRFTAGTALRL